MDNLSILIIGLVTLVLGVVLFMKRRNSYWKSKGVPQLEPEFFFGDTKKLFTKKFGFGEQFKDIYRQFKAKGVPFGGYYNLLSPCFMPLDPVLIKTIIVKDFNYFTDRGGYVNEKDDPLSGHLAFLEGEKWKNLRTKLTPTFTSGKMKMMFETFMECTEGLKKTIDEYAVTQEPVDIKDILQRFTMDIIGTIAFGLDFNVMSDPNNEFRNLVKKLFKPSKLVMLKMVLMQVLPTSILHALHFSITPKDLERFFIKLVSDTVTHREKNNIARKDLMHLLLQLKNRGHVANDDSITNEKGQTGGGLTINEIAAQCFVFFGAGFETSSSTMTFALYELSRSQGCQDKLRKEINETLKKYNNELSYDAVMEMDYLDRVVKETLRMHAPVTRLSRVCTKNYTVPGTNVVIEKGTTMFVSLLGLHWDAEYFPQPEKFDPDRYTPENVSKRPAYTYLPFGDGPRSCIGMRFGVLQSKVGLITMIQNYAVTLNEKTEVPLKMDKFNILNAVEGGVWFNFNKVK